MVLLLLIFLDFYYDFEQKFITIDYWVISIEFSCEIFLVNFFMAINRIVVGNVQFLRFPSHVLSFLRFRKNVVWPHGVTFFYRLIMLFRLSRYYQTLHQQYIGKIFDETVLLTNSQVSPHINLISKKFSISLCGTFQMKYLMHTFRRNTMMEHVLQ